MSFSSISFAYLTKCQLCSLFKVARVISSLGIWPCTLHIVRTLKHRRRIIQCWFALVLIRVTQDQELVLWRPDKKLYWTFQEGLTCHWLLGSESVLCHIQVKVSGKVGEPKACEHSNERNWAVKCRFLSNTLFKVKIIFCFKKEIPLETWPVTLTGENTKPLSISSSAGSMYWNSSPGKKKHIQLIMYVEKQYYHIYL